MPVASSGPAALTSGPYVVVVVLTCSGERTMSPRGSSLLLCLEVEGRGAGTDEQTNDELQRPIICWKGIAELGNSVFGYAELVLARTFHTP